MLAAAPNSRFFVTKHLELNCEELNIKQKQVQNNHKWAYITGNTVYKVLNQTCIIKCKRHAFRSIYIFAKITFIKLYLYNLLLSTLQYIWQICFLNKWICGIRCDHFNFLSSTLSNVYTLSERNHKQYVEGYHN